MAGMRYEEFLNRIIDEGKAAASRSYARPDQAAMLEGSLAGFEACRRQTPANLDRLLKVAQTSAEEATRNSTGSEEDLAAHWKARTFALEVEWVCNVLSAAFMNMHMPVIVPPTTNGMKKAIEILGLEYTQDRLPN